MQLFRVQPHKKIITKSLFPTDCPLKALWKADIAATYTLSVEGVWPSSKCSCRKDKTNEIDTL